MFDNKPITLLAGVLALAACSSPTAPQAGGAEALFVRPPVVGQPRIAFRSYRDGAWDIYTMNADGSGAINLTNSAAEDGQPVVSPDGSKIAFNSWQDGHDEIYVMNIDGSGEVRLTHDLSADIEPTWSPDGTKIAFTSYRSGQADIYVMDARSGATLARLTTDGSWQPAWSPDGSKIAFSKLPSSGIPEVWVMNADGSGKRRLRYNAERPAWSPDGTKLACDGYAGTSIEIFAIDATSGSLLTQLTNNPSYDADPAWSPDGSKIAFTSNRAGTYNVYVMSATDGSGVVRLTTVGSNMLPSWVRPPLLQRQVNALP